LINQRESDPILSQHIRDSCAPNNSLRGAIAKGLSRFRVHGKIKSEKPTKWKHIIDRYAPSFCSDRGLVFYVVVGLRA
jgi:hypothetical protein